MMQREELLDLIDAVLDERCSEADFVRLEAELHIDPDARQLYYERMQLHTTLEREIGAGEVEIAQSKTRWMRQHWRLFSGLVTAALLVAASLIGWQLGRNGASDSLSQEAPVISEPVAAGFAVLTEQADAIWQGNEINRGELIPQGRLHLSKGLAQLELFSGVTLTIEGEAEFELHSDMEITMHSGRMRAVVPPAASGFRVKTTTGDIVDLGTEFALDIQDSRADVHVIDGEVEWHPLAAQEPMRLLQDGDSIGWTGDVESTPATESKQFASLKTLISRKADKCEKWTQFSKTMADDSRLLAYFPMNQPGDWQRQLVDTSQYRKNGTIVLAPRVTDRWGQANRALWFSPTGSRVRVNIPGEHSAVTLFCWVRIDSLDKRFNSLFLTDGHELGEPHWQIMNDGRLFFSVKRREATMELTDKQIVYSPPIWTPELSGQWFQVAAVYSSESGTISHYLNGERIAHEKLAEEYIVDKVKIGSASIANWSDSTRDDPGFAVRNLNGVIDEFAIFGEALSDLDIRNLYQIGKP